MPDTFITIHGVGLRVTAREEVTLRRASEDDAPWLAEVCARAYGRYLERGPYVPGGLAKVESPRSHIRFMGYFHYYRIDLGGSAAGGLMVAPRGPSHVEVVNVFVDPECWGRGVASAALSAAEGMYPDAGLWSMGVPEWDEAAADLARGAGYSEVGVTVEDDGTRLRWLNRSADPVAVTPIGSLRDGMRNVHVEGSVQEKAQARAVRGRRPGESLSVADAGLADGTGRVVLTLWNAQIRLVQVGDRVRVENGYVGGYRGVAQLSAGKSGRVIKLGPG